MPPLGSKPVAGVVSNVGQCWGFYHAGRQDVKSATDQVDLISALEHLEVNKQAGSLLK